MQEVWAKINDAPSIREGNPVVHIVGAELWNCPVGLEGKLMAQPVAFTSQHLEPVMVQRCYWKLKDVERLNSK